MAKPQKKKKSQREDAPKGGSTSEPKWLYAIESLLLISFIIFGSTVAMYLNEEPPPKRELKIPGMIEAESLAVLAKSEPYVYELQNTEAFNGGQWTGNSQMFARSNKPGSWIEWQLPINDAGKYHLAAYLTKSTDYGIVQMSVNGKTIGSVIDLWAYGVTTTGRIDIGNFEALAGGNKLKLEVVGKNEKGQSPFYQFGLDGLIIEKIP